MSDDGAGKDQDEREARIAELEAEVLQLRAQVVRLRAQNADLLQSAIDRDYEKPPHYR